MTTRSGRTVHIRRALCNTRDRLQQRRRGIPRPQLRRLPYVYIRVRPDWIRQVLHNDGNPRHSGSDTSHVRRSLPTDRVQSKRQCQLQCEGIVLRSLQRACARPVPAEDRSTSIPQNQRVSHRRAIREGLDGASSAQLWRDLEIHADG